MSSSTTEALEQRYSGLFPSLLGIQLLDASAEGVTAELEIRDELCTVPGVGHGGVLMAFADTLGALGTILNLRDGATTTTLESKTNFLGAARQGRTLRGECTPIHRGGTTMVWQTRILDGEKLLALVTQTQMVLRPKS